MTKRLCKLTRQEIRDGLEDIVTLVSQPQYVCRACARTCVSQAMLCNPESIQLNLESVSTEQFELATELPNPHSMAVNGDTPSDADMQRKKLKKELKKQKEYCKEMKKVLKKQQKLLKKQQDLELEFTKANQLFHMTADPVSPSPQVH